jgi:hypothetical protein
VTAVETGEGTADRVTLAYAPVTDTVREEVETDRYGAYLRRTRAGAAAVGDEWTEFVNCGCGTTEDVTLVVTGVEGGEAVGDGTEFAFVPADG